MSSQYPCIIQTLIDNISMICQLPRLAIFVVIGVKVFLTLFTDLIKFIIFLVFIFFLTRCMFRMVETVVPKIDCIVPQEVKNRILSFSDKVATGGICPPQTEQYVENKQDVKQDKQAKQPKQPKQVEQDELDDQYEDDEDSEDNYARDNSYKPGSSSTFKSDTGSRRLSKPSVHGNSLGSYRTSLLSGRSAESEKLTHLENFVSDPEAPETPETPESTLNIDEGENAEGENDEGQEENQEENV